jgi:predicted transposase YbfD/YdcC
MSSTPSSNKTNTQPQQLASETPASSNTPAIILILQELEDPRIDRARKHHLSDILFISLCAVICGCESFEDMEEFGIAKEEWFRKYLELPNGIPSHDTFTRVYKLLKPESFQNCLIKWTQNIRETIAGENVAIDGKAQRRARNKNQNLHYIVNAWAGQNRLLLGQYKVAEKSNEITAIPELLRILELSGCIISCDAMGCQKTIAKEIIEADADYVLALKGNHETAHEEISEYLQYLAKEKNIPRGKNAAPASPAVQALGYHTESEKGHGRTTTWHYYQSAELEWFEDKNEWEGLKSVGMVHTITEENGKVREEKRYYLSSLSLDVKKLSQSIRSHWGVENQCHWVMDVVFKEDESRGRSGHIAQNYGTTRGLAMNMIRQEPKHKRGIKGRVKRAGWDNNYLEQILKNYNA